MRKSIFLLIIATLLVLSACTATKDTSDDSVDKENNDGKKVLMLNNSEEPTSFDPAIGFDQVSWDPLNNLMEGLTRLDDDHKPGPAVAEGWEISDDEMIYTFKLRDDANWSNGDPVTADDFIYAWQRLLDPETASSAAFLGYFIKGAEEFNSGDGSADDLGLTAIDDKTFEVELESSTGYFLNLVTNPAFFPVNKEVAEKDEKWHTEADSFVSNGPFELKTWDHDDKMVMVKNEEYWDAETVKLDEVEWAMVDSENTEYQMYESGELDVSEIPVELSDELIEGDDVYIEEQGGLDFYRFNVEEEPFTNKKIRQAFAKAVDREEIAEYVVKDGVEPAHGFVSPGFITPDNSDFRDANGDLVTYDKEEAKKLLEEGMKEEGYDELPPVTLSYNTDDTNKAVAETLQNMFSDSLGIDVTLENKEWNVFLDEQQALKHQFSRSSFLFDYGDPINFLESFITDSSMNRTGFSNDAYDKIIKKIKEEKDEEKRWDLMYEAELILAEEMPMMPIRYYNQVELIREGVTGVLRHPVGYLDLKFVEKE